MFTTSAIMKSWQCLLLWDNHRVYTWSSGRWGTQCSPGSPDMLSLLCIWPVLACHLDRVVPGLHGGARASVVCTVAHSCGMAQLRNACVFILQQMHTCVCCPSGNWPCTRCTPSYPSLHTLHCLLSQNNFCENKRLGRAMGQTGGWGKPCPLHLTTWVCPKYICIFIVSREFQKNTN